MLMPMPVDDLKHPAAPPDTGMPGDAGGAAAGASGAVPGRDYGAVLWQPDARSAERARITGYLSWLRSQRGIDAASYQELWRWSVTQPGTFWTTIWDFFEVLGTRGSGPALTGTEMPDVHWFPGASLNYARNALRAADADPGRPAVIYRSEAGHDGTLTYGDLRREAARVQQALRAAGVAKGDRVAGYLPNSPQALVALLATASLGAIWSSCSPDFGRRSVIDRFAQISPKVLIAVDGYVYGGKRFDRREEVGQIAAALPGLETLIMVDYLRADGARPRGERDGRGTPGLPDGREGQLRVLSWDALPPGPDHPEIAEVGFEHPLWVLYSSGTTGLPKPIVHGHGGIVLEHLKMLALHTDLGPGDVFFWHTTTGWMMWNYLASSLLVGATAVLYDGSATHPGPDALWRLMAKTGATYAGTGAPYLLASRKAGLRPGADLDLSRLRGLGSTGSPLPPEGFRWVYESVAPGRTDLILGSLSGGTDLCTGFVGPCPLLPVRAGIISGPCLGARVEAYDPAGHPLAGEVGELVLTVPMPSMPVCFWGDAGGERYRASYFSDYPGVWRHGDWIAILPDGGCIIYGRSDATLNRGGVRMGTSEFYRVVESLPEVADSLVVDTGRLGEEGRLILYVVPAAGHALDDALAARIRSALRHELSPRHVPDEIRQVPGIPRTLSGKKLEVPVRKMLLGTPPAQAADPDSLANPEVLASFVTGAGS
jgi:acetoacetyl-CoA synthetase